MSAITNKNRWKYGDIISSYWVVFGVVSLLFVGLVLETSIVSVSGFQNVHNSDTDIPIFIGLVLLGLTLQLIILIFVHVKIHAFVSFRKSRLHLVYKSMFLTQLVVIGLLLAVLFEVTLTFSYHLILLKGILLASSIATIGVMLLLSSRFIV